MKESPYALKDIKNEKLVQALSILQEVKMTNILFNEFPHPELVKRFTEIIQFLVVSGAFKVEDADLILSCYKSKPFDRYLFHQ